MFSFLTLFWKSRTLSVWLIQSWCYYLQYLFAISFFEDVILLNYFCLNLWGTSKNVLIIFHEIWQNYCYLMKSLYFIGKNSMYPHLPKNNLEKCVFYVTSKIIRKNYRNWWLPWFHYGLFSRKLNLKINLINNTTIVQTKFFLRKTTTYFLRIFDLLFYYKYHGKWFFSFDRLSDITSYNNIDYTILNSLTFSNILRGYAILVE